MKRFLTILMIVLLAISITTFTVLASEPTEAMTETTTESAETEVPPEPTEAMTEAQTEAMTEEPTAKPTDAPTESPTEEQGTPISFGAVFAIGNRVIKLINKHKIFITSALSALTSLLLAAIVANFKSNLKTNNKNNESSVAEIKEENKKANEKLQEEIEKIKGVVNEGHEMITNMIESYEKERADLHAADATAEIDHEFATMMYHLIMNSNVGMGIKDEVETLYKKSEEKINHMIEDAKKERGENHGTGEHQSANG